eukprot:GHVS01027893.1.p2 GENE.GHVS01027893.1~~GHVS01027893.1.p2  ORF type:complete len:201 (+),score=17.31 GHVS01027893.1:833-1435(+)
MHRPELLHGAHRRYLQEVAERYVYASLFSVLWHHLVISLRSRETLVQRAMNTLSRDQQSLLADLQVPPSLYDIDLQSPSAAILQLRTLHTPHEKLECLENVCELIYKAVEEHSKRAGSPTQMTAKRMGPVEVTGDEVLALWVACLAQSRLKHCVANTALVDMSLSQKPTGSRLAKASYVYTTFHSAVTYLLHHNDAQMSQ